MSMHSWFGSFVRVEGPSRKGRFFFLICFLAEVK